MAVNKRLLQGAAAAGEFVPSEHFGVVLYEGDGASSHSINGGKFGAAFYGNGSNSRINLGNGKFRFNELSISVWVKPSGSGHRTILENYEYSGGSAGFIFRIDQTTNKARFVIYNGDCNNPYPDDTNCSNVTAAVSTNAIPTNAYTHIVVTMKIGELKMYINGSLDVSTVTQSIGYIPGASTNIGAAYHAYAGSGESFYEGKIDQLRVFAKVLSSTEVSTLYAETVETVESLDPLSEDTTDTLQVLGDSSCIATYRFENDETDESGNYDGTGTEIQYAAGRYGQAASFNGSSSYIDLGSNMSLSGNSFSFSFWYANTETTSGGDVNTYVIGDLDTTDQTNKRLHIGRRSFNEKLTFAFNGNDMYSATNVSTDGTWQHWVCTFNASNQARKIYLNGVLDQSQTASANYTGTANITIGKAAHSNSYAKGRLDQVRVFNKELSASEVTTLYNENSLVASYRFEGNANDDMRAYDGTASNVTYEYGLNFTPDFVWIKSRTNTLFHNIVNSTVGANYVQYANSNSAGETNSNIVTSLDSGGFTVGNDNSANQDGQDFVAWCWKANGGTTSSNTDGSITSTVQTNTDAGFSIVKWTSASSGSSYTVGHGLDTAPDVIIFKYLGISANWIVYHTGISGSATNKLFLDLTNAATSYSDFPSATPTDSTFSMGSASIGGYDLIAYCFKNVDGFSKFGSYTGNASTDGPIVETGFEPAFLMIKNIGDADRWFILDNKRSPVNPKDEFLDAQDTHVESDLGVSGGVNFLSNGFQLKSSNSGVNGNYTYIYMAFAADPDTEAPTVAKSFSTVTYTGTGSSGNSITGLGFEPSFLWLKSRSGAIGDFSHTLMDTVRGADKSLSSNNSNNEVANANGLESFDTDGFTVGSAGGGWNYSGSNYVAWAWKADDNEPTIFGGPARAVYKFEDNLNDVTGNNNSNANASITYNSSGKFNKSVDFNGTSSYFTVSSLNNLFNTWVSISYSLWIKTTDSSAQFIVGTATDEQNYKALASISSGKLTPVTRKSGTVYSASSSTSINDGNWHHIVITYDNDNGITKGYVDGVEEVSFATGGSSSGSLTIHNVSVGANYQSGNGNFYNGLDGEIDQLRFYNGVINDIGVAALYAETASDNDDLTLGGPPETIISANANAGFSIVKYTGTGGAAKIPHGLSAKCDLVIIKTLDSSNNWIVQLPQLGDNARMLLDSTSAKSDDATTAQAGNASYFGIGADNSVAKSGDEFIAYCFHSVSGYSKIGSYTGNGSSNSITTGFQPDFVLIKNTGRSGTTWNIQDSVRGTTKYLMAQSSDSEYTDSGINLTFTSTGFTLNNSYQGWNENGDSYIYMAIKIN